MGARGVRQAGLWRRVLAAMGLGASLCGGAGFASADPTEEVLRAGDYLLRTRILHAGTRSEGRIGRLFHKGVERPGKTPGEQIEVTTPDGTVRFTYLGTARPYLWSVSGWTDRAVARPN